MIPSFGRRGLVGLPLALALTGCGGGGPAAEPSASPVASPVASGVAIDQASPQPSPSDQASPTAPASETAAMTNPVAPKPTAKGDPVRRPGGLESKCLAAVAKETNVPVGSLGTNRIVESQAAIDVYVNVPNAIAPWKCHGYRDGTVDGVEFTGSEGRL